MTADTAAPTVISADTSPERLRAWWSHRQGLDGSWFGSSAEQVLRQAGWARSVGGSGPYLGLFARAGLGREAVDAAVARLEVHELPSARGCTYVLPRDDYALGLTVGAAAPAGELAAAGKHLGVTGAEIDALCAATVQALAFAERPLDPAAIRAATGDAVRALGEAGLTVPSDRRSRAYRRVLGVRHRSGGDRPSAVRPSGRGAGADARAHRGVRPRRVG
jgi:hypothetical protein